MNFKHLAARFLLFYSTILAVFISVSGFFTARSIEPVLFQLAFLPVTMFLFITSLKEIRKILKKEKPSANVTLSGKKTEAIIGIILLIILVFVGAKNSFTGGQEVENNYPIDEKVSENTEESDPIIFEGEKVEDKNYLVVEITDGSPEVNLRNGPGTFYETVGTAQDSDEFEYLEVENGWYKIIFNDEEAYIFEDYVKLKEK